MQALRMAPQSCSAEGAVEAVARTMCACPPWSSAKITVPGSRSYRLRGCYLSWAPSEAQTGGPDYRGRTLPLPEGLIPALTEGPCLAPSEGSPRLLRDVVKWAVRVKAFHPYLGIACYCL